MRRFTDKLCLLMIFTNLLRCTRKNVGIFKLICGKDDGSKLSLFGITYTVLSYSLSYSSIATSRAIM